MLCFLAYVSPNEIAAMQDKFPIKTSIEATFVTGNTYN